MIAHKNSIAMIVCLLLLVANTVFANNQSSVEFFASNNTKEINIQEAYSRLTGKEQQDLQNSMIVVLQKYHVEQGRFEDILGAYRMSNDKKVTADNTEHFNTSPYQHLSEEKIFSIAKDLANALNQDSVAVLIPNQATIGAITVSFNSHQPGILELISLLHNKLPAFYSQAFSINLVAECGSFNNAKVDKIEWLGSKINLAEIKKTFPDEKIQYHYGKVFLIYKNGRQEQL